MVQRFADCARASIAAFTFVTAGFEPAATFAQAIPAATPSPDPISILAPLLQARAQAEAMIVDVNSRTTDPKVLTPVGNTYVALQGKANGFVQYLGLSIRSGHYDAAVTQSSLQEVVKQADSFEDEAGQIQQQGFFASSLLTSLADIIHRFAQIPIATKPLFDRAQQQRDAYATAIESQARWRSWSAVTAISPDPRSS